MVLHLQGLGKYVWGTKMKDKLFAVGEVILNASTADETEVLLFGTKSQLTRFANSVIHQNVYEENVEITVRAIVDKRIGVVSANLSALEEPSELAKLAKEVAERTPKVVDFEHLPSPAPVREVRSYFSSTIEVTSADKASVIEKLVKRATPLGITLSGVYETSEIHMVILNSNGISLYYPGTWAVFKVVSLSDTSQGYAVQCELDAAKLEPEKVGERSIEKCDKGKNPRDIEPGKYDIVVEPYGMAEILSWLAWLGLGALSVIEKRSFLCDRFGSQVASEVFTLYDDGYHPLTFPWPFDFEGVPKRKVVIIENGIAKDVVYDSYTAKKLNKENTGHAVTPEASRKIGPIPSNLVVEPGSSTVDELVASVSRGLYVTKFHYVNGMINPREAIFTGMTRGGVFYIEDGKIRYPVKNLRFTESMLTAFKHIEKVGNDLTRVGLESEIGAYAVPSMLIRGFNFTGKTEY